MLSNFLWYEILVHFFPFFWPTNGTNHEHDDCLRIKQSKTHTHPESEEGSHRCCTSTKPSAWGTILSKTHDMPKKSRAAREQPDKLFAILAEHTEFAELMRIYTNIHKSLQALDHAKTCSTVSGQPWNQLDAMVKTRWWSLLTFLDSFIFHINKTQRYMRDCPKHPNVPLELYNLTDLLIGDLECAHEVAQGIRRHN